MVVNPPTQKAVQARTRRARSAVIDAARQLFGEHGYAAATIEAISARSGVPPATVYRLFASKLGILRALIDVSIAGDDGDVAVADRPHVVAARGAPGPVAVLAGFAAIVSEINQRTNVWYHVLVVAAGSDPEAAELLRGLRRQRDEGQRQFVTALAGIGALRHDLSEQRAADVVHALASPELYRMFTEDRGWSATGYRDWLSATLQAQLVG